MKTKFNINDIVYIPCIVSNITICGDKEIYYQVEFDKKKDVYIEGDLKSKNNLADNPKELIAQLENKKQNAHDIQHSTSFQFDTGIDEAIKAIKAFYDIGE